MYDSCSSTRSLWKVFFRFECHSTFSRCCVTRKKEEVLVFLKKSIIHQNVNSHFFWRISRWSEGLRGWRLVEVFWDVGQSTLQPHPTFGWTETVDDLLETASVDVQTQEVEEKPFAWIEKTLTLDFSKWIEKKFEYINLALDNTLLYQLDVRLTKMLVAVLQGFLISQPYSTLNVVHFILYVIVETTHKQIFNIFTVAMLNKNL